MVILENPAVYNVVLIVEGTANVGAYFDLLKSAYILPTLEYFNGGPAQEVDYGCITNCSLYTLVTFHGSDRAPGLLSSCQQPMTSTHLFAQSLDHIEFASGSGDSGGHLAEGLSTALQVFDELEQLREPNLTPQNHCILVCNSAPYQLTSQESLNYCGFTCDQMILKFVDRGINFSIISPRKIPALYTLFELAGGESPSSSSAKNYTSDSRHLVLLKGYQLTERPVSPSAKKEDLISEIKQGGGPTLTVKQTTSISSLPVPGPRGPANNMQRMPVPPSGSNNLAKDIANDIFNAANQATVDNVNRRVAMTQSSAAMQAQVSGSISIPPSQNVSGQSGSIPIVMNSMNQGGSAAMGMTNMGQVISGQMMPGIMNMSNMSVPGSTAMTIGPALTGQQGSANLSMANISQGMQNQQLTSQMISGFQQQRPVMAQQSHQLNQLGQQSNPGTMPLNQPSLGQPQMPSAQPQLSIGQSQTSSGQTTISTGQGQLHINATQTSIGQSTMSMSQPINIVNPTTMTMAPTLGSLPQVHQPGQQVMSGNQFVAVNPSTMIQAASFVDNMPFSNPTDSHVLIGPSAGIDSSQNLPGGPPQPQQQRTIWSGTLDWQEKQKQGDTGARLTRSLPCQIFVSPEEVDINASKWPPKLVMNLIPNTLLQPLQSLFRNSRTVGFQFSQKDQETLNSLYKVMAAGFGGCVNIPTTNMSANDVRVLMLLYSNRKRMFMGLIPNDQVRFVNGIRSVITRHRNQTNQLRMHNAATFGGGMQGMLGMPGQPGSQPVGAGGVPVGQGGNMVGISPGGVTSATGSVNMVGGSAAGGAQIGQTMVMGMPQSQALVNQQQFQQVANDQQRQQFLVQQHQQQQQQLQHQQLNPTNQQLRHLLLNQPQMRQQLLMQQQQQQQRARVPGPQQGLAPGPQQSLGPNMNAQSMQNNASQNFMDTDELAFELG